MIPMNKFEVHQPRYLGAAAYEYFRTWLWCVWVWRWAWGLKKYNPHWRYKIKLKHTAIQPVIKKKAESNYRRLHRTGISSFDWQIAQWGLLKIICVYIVVKYFQVITWVLLDSVLGRTIISALWLNLLYTGYHQSTSMLWLPRRFMRGSHSIEVEWIPYDSCCGGTVKFDLMQWNIFFALMDLLQLFSDFGNAMDCYQKWSW